MVLQGRTLTLFQQWPGCWRLTPRALSDEVARNELHDKRTITVAEFSVIKASEAPAPPKQTGRLRARMGQYDAFVAAVGAGKVGKLTPAADESARGVALRVSRAGKRVGKSVNTWVADGIVFFKIE